MKFISLFAGIGGFDLALTRQGHECVWANEWDKYAAQIYDKNFNIRIDTRDIRTVPAEEIPDHDLLCGGFPCQAFSIAGKRRGFDDTRGTLFFEIARILREKKPRLCLLENVKGLLSHDNGNTFKTIIATLDELGYDLQWQVLNSKNFGVPQNRERVFIIGHLRGTPRPKVFPIGENSSKNGSSYEQTRTSKDEIASTVTTEYAKNQHGNQYVAEMLELTTGVSDAQRIYDPSGIAKTLKGLGGGMGAKTGLYSVKAEIRRLTPIECERLQGFPDGWTEIGIIPCDGSCKKELNGGFDLMRCGGHEVKISDSQRYKCLGNAVTVNVVEYIVKYL
jgi:DNA (cytosine-5)-methyltransferase 1